MTNSTNRLLAVAAIALSALVLPIVALAATPPTPYAQTAACEAAQSARIPAAQPIVIETQPIVIEAAPLPAQHPAPRKTHQVCESVPVRSGQYAVNGQAFNLPGASGHVLVCSQR